MTLQEKWKAIEIIKDSPDIEYDRSFEASQGCWFVVIRDGQEYINFDRFEDLEDYLKSKYERN